VEQADDKDIQSKNMTDDKLQLNDLSPYYKRVEIIKDTAEQIKKDFEIFSESITFSGSPNTAYDELKSQIEPIISKLMNNNYERLLSVLYRIDVNEKSMSEEIYQRNDEEPSSIITDLIIERELKKVIIRNYFKNNQGKKNV